ncbi:hypothetical protein EYF80_051193 [Liparis tanakae]|uniref:Uncharacterized protein n=1 Tax=Liparis tanakae TaxID=230148 RepID=A0A4Z2FCN0_9TELE|nr:hypothetical protein EYF80_051193 [Liparis tanakae]
MKNYVELEFLLMEDTEPSGEEQAGGVRRPRNPAGWSYRRTGAREDRSTGGPEHRRTGGPEHRRTGGPARFHPAAVLTGVAPRSGARTRLWFLGSSYLCAAVLASRIPAPCIQERTGVMPVGSGSSFMVRAPRGRLSWMENIKVSFRELCLHREPQEQEEKNKKKKKSNPPRSRRSKKPKDHLD